MSTPHDKECASLCSYLDRNPSSGPAGHSAFYSLASGLWYDEYGTPIGHGEMKGRADMLAQGAAWYQKSTKSFLTASFEPFKIPSHAVHLGSDARNSREALAQQVSELKGLLADLLDAIPPKDIPKNLMQRIQGVLKASN